MTNRIRLLLFGAILLAVPIVGVAQLAPEPTKLLARARHVMGFDALDGRVLHQRWASAVEQPYQSDRTYPPFFSMMVSGESWFDPQTTVLRTVSQAAYPGTPLPQTTLISDSAAAFSLRDKAAPVQIATDANRYLDAWLVIAEWSNASGVRFAGRENYRDYPRLVLARQTPDGQQRLFLDEKTGFPLKLEYEAPHYLWGQQKIQYVFSNWQQSGPVFTANSSFHMADDDIETSRTVSSVELVSRDLAVLTLPDVAHHAVNKTPLFLQPLPPKVVDVSADVKILSNPGYNEAFTVIGEEAFVFDATQGEERARQDRDAILKLHPTVKKFTLVVTDLAWPHVSGVRYWVANGATIVSHRAAEPFLKQVLDRHWTAAPDSYEKLRNRSKLQFIAVDHERDLAGGKIKIFAIDGIGSEVALAVLIVPDRFLWASDYIQTLSEPSMYAMEVMAAVQREHIAPERVAAEHLPLNDWGTVVAAQQLKPANSGN